VEAVRFTAWRGANRPRRFTKRSSSAYIWKIDPAKEKVDSVCAAGVCSQRIDTALACGKQDKNPRKPHENTHVSPQKKAMTWRISAELVEEKFFCNFKILKGLFQARIVLDTALARPYYAARKF
jgi:hypothetical protein